MDISEFINNSHFVVEVTISIKNIYKIGGKLIIFHKILLFILVGALWFSFSR